MRVGPYEFREVVLADFEFSTSIGERPRPICLVARELHGGRTHRIFSDDLSRLTLPPYPCDEGTLFVAYYASAELGCHLARGWRLPTHVLDLYAEFRNLRNGVQLPDEGRGLLSALIYFGLDAMDAVEKEDMRRLAMRGGPFTEAETRNLLAYCETDVIALEKLLPRMLPRIDLPRALLRGQYMGAVARIEHVGVPISTQALAALRENWRPIQGTLIREIDSEYGVYDGTTFKEDRWALYLRRHNIPWLTHPSGRLVLDDDTFRDMARSYPCVRLMRELRCSLSQMRLEDLAVGKDGRNRVMLSAFGARTSRNQPSNAKFIFGPATWLRGLIQPPPEYGLAYIDWSQQEFGIAAVLSGDTNMIAAYESGDPYLAFAIQAGAVPASATKKSHGFIRDQFKACALAVQYGMGPDSLALRINQCPAAARELINMHKQTYPRFWRWSDGVVDYAMLCGELFTTFGWTIHADSNTNPRSLRNFPMQANGAEMLRFACSFAIDRGIDVCAPIHDAILIEAPLEDLDHAILEAQRAMSDASALVLDGFRLRSEAKVFRYPNHYEDERGVEMWNRVWNLMAELKAGVA
jgi:hypothetical protein